MSDADFKHDNLSGLLLIATPNLVDPFFRKTVVLLMHHSTQEGSLGFVINRPMGLTVGQVVPQVVEGVLSGVPLYYGGPVGAEQPVLLGLRSGVGDSLDVRKFAVGSMVSDIPGEWFGSLRMFVGHSGWSPGQLEREIDQNSWIVLPPQKEVLESAAPKEIWQQILGGINPTMRVVAEMPDDFWKN